MNSQLFCILIAVSPILSSVFYNILFYSIKFYIERKKIMKLKINYVIQKTGKTGNPYYIFINQGSMSSKAVTVFGNTPCIGCDSIDELAEIVVNLDKGQFLEIDFVVDQSNNIAVAIVC